MHAQEPPSELRELSELLRFVSLVPFLEDVVTSVEAKEDVWTTTAEFLHIGAGGPARARSNDLVHAHAPRSALDD